MSVLLHPATPNVSAMDAAARTIREEILLDILPPYGDIGQQPLPDHSLIPNSFGFVQTRTLPRNMLFENLQSILERQPMICGCEGPGRKRNSHRCLLMREIGRAHV